MATATSVEALAPGDHACLTFSDPDERLDIVAAFVRDGLSAATKVMCVTESIPPDQLSQELSERGVPVAEALPTSQLMIFSSDESWVADGELTAATMVERVRRHLVEAERQGFSGLRLSADMCWVKRPHASADQLPAFVSAVGKLFSDGRLTAVCHRLDELTLALNEALHLDHDIQVNLAKLRFLDAACASAISQAALALPAGRVMSIVCGGAVQRTLRLAGASEIPSVRVVSTHGER